MSWSEDSVLNKTLNFLINSASNPVISPFFSGFRKNPRAVLPSFVLP